MVATIKGKKTLIELAQDFDVQTNQINQWRDHLLERATRVAMPFQEPQHCFGDLTCGIGLEMKAMITGEFDFIVIRNKVLSSTHQISKPGAGMQDTFGDQDAQNRTSDCLQDILDLALRQLNRPLN